MAWSPVNVSWNEYLRLSRNLDWNKYNDGLDIDLFQYNQSNNTSMKWDSIIYLIFLFLHDNIAASAVLWRVVIMCIILLNFTLKLFCELSRACGHRWIEFNDAIQFTLITVIGFIAHWFFSSTFEIKSCDVVLFLKYYNYIWT